MEISNSGWTSLFNVFEYVKDKGIDVVREDGMELACYCPFHANADTPAFYINKRTGLWICFNPGCGKRGSLKDLMEHFGDQHNFHHEVSIAEIEAMLVDDKIEEIDDGWADTLDKVRVDLPEDNNKVAYLLDRGFSEDTLRYFEIGYSEKKGRIVIPVRDEHYNVIGFIGRATNPNYQPKYLYSKGFPRKSALFNLNNAKKFGGVIVVEGSLDAMKVHQSGYPNVVSTLGAAVTKEHMELLNRYFNKIIVFSDNDHAGFVMRDHIIQSCSDHELMIVKYPSPDIKDPGDMSKEQIDKCIENASDYLAWVLDV